MGCATSKLDDLPAVSLCRDRCAYLDEAIRQRYAFADAHLAYLHALKSVGLSLDRYFNQDLEPSFQDTLPPVLNLPAERKGDPSDFPWDKIHHLHSHSDSGSHLHFHSDDSDEDDGFALDALHQHDVTLPASHHTYGSYVPGYENINFPGEAGGGGFTNINFMKNQATPPVLYTQRRMSPKSVLTGESMSSSSSYFSDNINNNNNKYPLLLIIRISAMIIILMVTKIIQITLPEMVFSVLLHHLRLMTAAFCLCHGRQLAWLQVRKHLRFRRHLREARVGIF